MRQVTPNNSVQLRFLRLPDVCALVGLRKTSIYKGVADGTFPAPIKLSRRASVWPAAAVEAWIAGHIARAEKAKKASECV
jgi:prophage regulatory protein